MTDPTTLIVVPSFEKTRAELQLPLVLDPAESNRTIWLPWLEDQDPYAALAAYIPSFQEGPLTVVVDENVRSGIASDLGASLSRELEREVKVVSSPPAIRTLRERKTAEEIERLVCANEVRPLRVFGEGPLVDRRHRLR